jgi:CRISPR system Cascade subunit CasA
VTYTFDLCTRPWVPCTTLDGSSIELGLREVLVKAHELRAVDDPSPLVSLALHRLLLAVLHRVLDGPKNPAEWGLVWKAGQISPELVDAYLDGYRHRFDLFDPEHPFFQVADFSTVDKKGVPTDAGPVTRLSVESSSGNNSTLFSHDVDSRIVSVRAAQATRMLVATQAFALGGGQGPSSNRFGKHPYSSHAPMAGAVAVLVTGKSLFETLLLNLLDHRTRGVPSQGGGDRPVWERDAPRPPGEVSPVGYLDYLTFRARAVRLLPVGPESDPRVAQAYVASGLSLPKEGGPLNTMAFHRALEKAGIRPVPLSPSKAVWRDSSTLFAFGKGRDNDLRPAALRQAEGRRYSKVLGRNRLLNISCYGLANDKAKAVTWRREELPAPVRLLEDASLARFVTDAVDAADSGSSALRKSVYLLCSALLETPQKKPDPAEVGRLQRVLLRRGAYWSRLDRSFPEFLVGLGTDPAVAASDWRKKVRDAVRRSFDDAAERAPGTSSSRLRAQAMARGHLAKTLSRVRGAENPAPSPSATRTPPPQEE